LRAVKNINTAIADLEKSSTATADGTLFSKFSSHPPF
jgi:hypothetical protein